MIVGVLVSFLLFRVLKGESLEVIGHDLNLFAFAKCGREFQLKCFLILKWFLSFPFYISWFLLLNNLFLSPWINLLPLTSIIMLGRSFRVKTRNFKFRIWIILILHLWISLVFHFFKFMYVKVIFILLLFKLFLGISAATSWCIATFAWDFCLPTLFFELISKKRCY